MDRIIVNGRRFVDNYGRHRIFNGVSICDKGCIIPKDKRARSYFTKSPEYWSGIIRKLSEDGFNIIRLGVTWDAIEPEPNVYDEEYIDVIQDFADLCAKNGIYFFIDMHQDLYSGLDKVGDGAPKWACLTGDAKVKPIKYVWATGYFWHKEIHNCFDNFWADEKVNGIGLQTYFINMWLHLVERFKDHPALFGFDLFNEPYPGTDGGKVFKKLILNLTKTVLTDNRCKKGWMIKQLVTGNSTRVLEPFSDPSLFRKVTKAGDELVKKFDEGPYSAFVNRLTKAIRSVTDKGVIFMEGCYYTNIGIPFSAPPITYDGKREPNLCYSPHTYDLTVDTPAYDYASNSRVWSIFEVQKNTQERLNIPMLIGEWGGFSIGTKWLKHIEYLLEKFDENQWSHTYYAFQPEFYLYDLPIMKSLIRPAPIAVCGKINKYSHNRENNTFEMSFIQEREYEVPTVIYAHKEIKSIETDGEYKIIPLNKSGKSKIELKTGIGEHKIKVSFI